MHRRPSRHAAHRSSGRRPARGSELLPSMALTTRFQTSRIRRAPLNSTWLSINGCGAGCPWPPPKSGPSAMSAAAVRAHAVNELRAQAVAGKKIAAENVARTPAPIVAGRGGDGFAVCRQRPAGRRTHPSRRLPRGSARPAAPHPKRDLDAARPTPGRRAASLPSVRDHGRSKSAQAVAGEHDPIQHVGSTPGWMLRIGAFCVPVRKVRISGPVLLPRASATSATVTGCIPVLGAQPPVGITQRATNRSARAVQLPVAGEAGRRRCIEIEGLD